MSKEGREWRYLILKDDGDDGEQWQKFYLMANLFVKVHSSNNFYEEEKG